MHVPLLAGICGLPSSTSKNSGSGFNFTPKSVGHRADSRAMPKYGPASPSFSGISVTASSVMLTPVTKRVVMAQKTTDSKWLEQALAARAEAEALPHGSQRDALMRKARQLETASQMNAWLKSPGLKPPS